MGRPGIITTEPKSLPEEELMARFLRALADRTRVRIVEALQRYQPLTQAELIRCLGVSQSRASEHLAILSWAGFIQAAPEGRTVSYWLTENFAGEILWLVREFMDASPHTDGE